MLLSHLAPSLAVSWPLTNMLMNLTSPKTRANRLSASMVDDLNYLPAVPLCYQRAASEDYIIRSFVFTVRAACDTTHGMLSQFCLSVRPSVCLSVRRVYCDKTKWWTIPDSHETAITVVFWHHQWLMGDVPFPVKIIFTQSYPPPSKNGDFDRFPLITSQP